MLLPFIWRLLYIYFYIILFYFDRKLQPDVAANISHVFIQLRILRSTVVETVEVVKNRFLFAFSHVDKLFPKSENNLSEEVLQ